jgi:hypothetical protein
MALRLPSPCIVSFIYNNRTTKVIVGSTHSLLNKKEKKPGFSGIKNFSVKLAVLFRQL